MGQSRPLFVYFCSFLITISIIQIEKSVDGVLGIRTQGCRMVGTVESMELWRLPRFINLTYWNTTIDSVQFVMVFRCAKLLTNMCHVTL